MTIEDGGGKQVDCDHFPTVKLLREALDRISAESGLDRRCPAASGPEWAALRAACAPGGPTERIDPDFVNDVLGQTAESMLRVSCVVDSPVGSGVLSVERIAGQYFHTRDDFGEIQGPFKSLTDAMGALDYGGGIADPDIEAVDALTLDQLKAFALGIMHLDNCLDCTINGRRYSAIKRSGNWELVAADAADETA